MATFTVKDKDGNKIVIPALKGEDGDASGAIAEFKTAHKANQTAITFTDAEGNTTTVYAHTANE